MSECTVWFYAPCLRPVLNFILFGSFFSSLSLFITPLLTHTYTLKGCCCSSLILQHLTISHVSQHGLAVRTLTTQKSKGSVVRVHQVWRVRDCLLVAGDTPSTRGSREVKTIYANFPLDLGTPTKRFWRWIDHSMYLWATLWNIVLICKHNLVNTCSPGDEFQVTRTSLVGLKLSRPSRWRPLTRVCAALGAPYSHRTQVTQVVVPRVGPSEGDDVAGPHLVTFMHSSSLHSW